MTRIRHFNDNGIDHWSIQRGGHPVIQQAEVHQTTFLVVEVLLVDCPADALHHSALHLTFDVAWMDGLADILQRGVAQYLHLARLGIHLHICYVDRESRTGAGWLDVCAARYGTTGCRQLAAQFFERHRLFGIRCRAKRRVAELDFFRLRFPDESETLLHPANYVLGCFVGRQPSRVRCPTAAGPTGVSYRIRVHDLWVDIVRVYTQHLGRLHRDRRPCAADIGGSFD